VYDKSAPPAYLSTFDSLSPPAYLSSPAWRLAK